MYATTKMVCRCGVKNVQIKLPTKHVRSGGRLWETKGE